MNKLKQIWANKWVRFAVATVIYLLWFVVWTRNLWWLLGVPVIYDYFISRYMDKFFLNRYRTYKSQHPGFCRAMDWVDAIIFAVIVVIPLKLYFFGMYVIPSSSMEHTLLVGDCLFVNKLAYGPRMPNTPIAFPFVHHTLPFTKNTPSFVEWIHYPYKRIAGFGSVKNDDVVVFNFPAGDTVSLDYQEYTYYDRVRALGYDSVQNESRVVYRPVDKRENYIKRCVAIAGDTLQVIDGHVHINGQPEQDIATVQYTYFVQMKNGEDPNILFERADISQSDGMSFDSELGAYRLSLTKKTAEKISRFPEVQQVMRNKAWGVSAYVFPQTPEHYPWNEDQYGPIWIPKAGATVKLDMTTLPLYERIIKNYEGNELRVSDNTIYINGQKADSYTFAMDYYFMMGDNRHNSADSRYWGFVPEDHIEGKASFVWLSTTPGKSLLTGIRWKRMFRGIN